MGTKTISASSQITGVANTLTITLNANVAIASGDVITISGITGTQTTNNAALPLNGADKAKFTPSGSGTSASTAGWTQNTGTLVLTANTAVNAGTDIVVTISVTNKASAQSAPTVNVEATTSGGIASSAMTGTNMAVVAPAAFSTKTISASNKYTGATNTLTITLNANVATASGDVITISGIIGTQTADNAALPLNGADKAKFTPSGTGASASTAGWTQNTGTLVLTAN